MTICAVFKNEGSYIEEWLDYHLCAGVDHFYLFDHRSTDNSVDIVEPYVKAGVCASSTNVLVGLIISYKYGRVCLI
jgi:hypothetical protein